MSQVDLIYKGQGQGDVANKLINNRLDVASMQPFIADEDGESYVSVYKGFGDPSDPENYEARPSKYAATLRRDEWKRLDEAIMGIAEYRLGGYQDLIDNNLVYTLGNGMGTTVLEWHDVGDALTVDMTMDGITRAQNDRPVYQHNYLPLPITHADYEINARVLSASRNLGNPIDTTLAERAARRVMEHLENMLFTNITYSYGEKDTRDRNTIYSYVNFPDRVQMTLSDYGSWDDNSATSGATILESVLAMKQAHIDNYHYGPWVLYIPTAYETRLDNDYDTTTPGTTIRERIMKISGISGIKVVDTLATDNVLMVEMKSETVRLVQGMPLQNVEWTEEGRFVNKYKVMTIQVPQIRSDQNGRTGIVHMA